MTVIEAAKAIVGDAKGQASLRRFLEGAVEQYLNRTLYYQEKKQPEAVATWRNATWDEQAAAAGELLREVIP